MTQIVQTFFDRVENIVGKGDNAVFFSAMFSKGFYPRGIRSCLCVVKGLRSGITNIRHNTIKSSPDDKILQLTKLKAFADDKIQYNLYSETTQGK